MEYPRCHMALQQTPELSRKLIPKAQQTSSIEFNDSRALLKQLIAALEKVQMYGNWPRARQIFRNIIKLE